jgi:hypothetical protein
MSVSGTFMLYTVRNMEIEQTRYTLSRHAEMINDHIVQLYDKVDFPDVWDASVWLSLGQSTYEIEGVILSVRLRRASLRKAGFVSTTVR